MRSNFTVLPFVCTNNFTQRQLQIEQASYDKNKIIYDGYQKFRNIIVSKFGVSVFKFISKYIINITNFKFVKDFEMFMPKQKCDKQFSCITKTTELNSQKDLNLFMRGINKNISIDDLFIGYINTENYKKLKTIAKYSTFLSIFISFYFSIITLFNEKSEFSFISKAELLGRLYYNGFEIISTKQLNTRLFFVAKKVGNAQLEKKKYNSIIKLKRIGLNGQKIEVYKLRSMYPYSEYIQEYVYKHNKLKAGGKFNNDFRISPLGKTLRKFWIDEIPMIINLIKGEMKLFGVRPLSSHYYQLYPDDLKELRIKTKPGLIPPFYADMPKTLEEIIQSEMLYLKQYMNSPLKTDFIYFFKALSNILLKGNRSN